MKPKLIVDPGSCHGGKKKTALEMVKVAKDCGADAIKFQLFPPSIAGQNIPLPYSWWNEIRDEGSKLGIEVFASVWERLGYELAKTCCGETSIKFAYSQRDNPLILEAAIDNWFENIYVSSDVMTRRDYPDMPKIKHLYCHTIHGEPVYPVVEQMNFRGLFPPFGGLFDGLSSHCLDWVQTLNAACNGAKIIEVHFQLGERGSVACPDSRFALTPEEVECLAQSLEGI